jgi:hypothetical protein
LNQDAARCEAMDWDEAAHLLSLADANLDGRVLRDCRQHDLDVPSEQPHQRCHLLVTKMNETAAAPSGRVQRVCA